MLAHCISADSNFEYFPELASGKKQVVEVAVVIHIYEEIVLVASSCDTARIVHSDLNKYVLASYCISIYGKVVEFVL